MKDSDLIYLEHEAATITIQNGKTWKVYGSPVRPEIENLVILSHDLYFTV